MTAREFAHWTRLTLEEFVVRPLLEAIESAWGTLTLVLGYR